MPTERKRAIRTAAAWGADQAAMEALYGVGGYYTSLSLWEAGEQANLTALDEIRTAVCYNDWPTGLVDELDINGWTTDATRYVRVTVAEGHRHNGTPGSGFHLRKSSSGSAMVLNRHRYSRFEWLDVEQQSTSTFRYCYRAFAQPDVVFYACIGKNRTQTTDIGCFFSDSGGGMQTWQCLAYGSVIGFNPNVFAKNCIAVGCGVGFGNSTTSGAGSSRNCIAYNCSQRGFSQNWNFNGTCSNDASSDTSASGTGSITGITSAAFADAANNDFHLSSGSVLRGAGVNLYSDFTTDIDGDTWPSSGAWDIGYDHYVAGGGGSEEELSATGAATATGAAALAASIALAGVGVALATGAAQPVVAADLAATGTTAATGTAAPHVDIALSALGLAIASGTADLSASAAGELAAQGGAAASGAAALAANVTISATGLAQAAAAAGLSAQVLLAGAGAAQAAGNAALAAQLSLLAQGAAQAGGTATISGSAAGELAAQGGASALGAAALVLDVRLAGTGAAQSGGTAELDTDLPPPITLAADGQAQASGAGTVAATVTLTGAGFVHAMGAGQLTISIALAAQGAGRAAGSATMVPLGLAYSAARRLAVGAEHRRLTINAENRRLRIE